MEKNVTLRDGRTLTVYRPRAADAAELLDYIKIVGGETDFLLMDGNGLPITVEREAELLESFYQWKRGGFFTGRIDGEIACTLSVSFHTRTRRAHICELAIAVKKKFWGIGVGSALMELAINTAREDGARTMELSVYADNVRARALYERFGFVQVGEHKNRLLVNGVYHDEIMMDLYFEQE